jgi:hypothetical protein
VKIQRQAGSFKIGTGKGPLKLKESPRDPDADKDEPKGTTNVAASGSEAGAKRIRDYFWRGGERWKIGQLARVSFSVWKRVEHYNPEGSRGPDGE